VLDNQYVLLVDEPAGKQVSAVYNIFFQTNVDDTADVESQRQGGHGDVPGQGLQRHGRVRSTHGLFTWR
jgi:hypothetical protein